VLNESDDEVLELITSSSQKYLKDSKADLALCAQKINPRTSTQT